jgi:hypothetical protein
MHNVGSQPSTASISSSGDRGLREDGEEKDGEERDESEVGLDDFLQSPATKTRSYRPRGKTYTYIESGAGPPTPPSQPSAGQGRGSQSLQFPDHSDRSVFVSSGTITTTTPHLFRWPAFTIFTGSINIFSIDLAVSSLHKPTYTFVAIYSS